MAPELQCMALFPCNRFPWKYSLCYPLNFTNKLEVDTCYNWFVATAVLQQATGEEQIHCEHHYRSSRGGFFDINFSAWKGQRDGESCNDAVARSVVGKQLPPGTLDEGNPLFLQNSYNEQVYAPF